MTLYEKPKTVLVYNNKEYRFFPYFNRVLAIAEEVLPDKLLTAEEKAEIIIPAVSDLPIETEAFELVLHELFPKQRRTNKPRIMDFTQDAELIYAAFLQCYQIDLYAEQDRLDWRIFLALLHGVSETTELARIIKLRNTKVPEMTKSNRNYVASLMEAKRAVAIKEPEGDAAKRMANAWRLVAEGLKRRCQTAK